jgi:hypothetical protein
MKLDVYEHSVKELHAFPQDPRSARNEFRACGGLIAGAGLLATWALGQVGLGLVGVSVAIAGAVLFFASPAMSRRTATGHRLYQHALGFREYLVTAERDRLAFAESQHLFHEYLPYAMAFGCVKQWTSRFEGLERFTSRAALALATDGLGGGDFDLDALSFDVDWFGGVGVGGSGGDGGGGD